MTKKERMKALQKQITQCKKCKDFNVKGVTQAVNGYGNIRSKVIMIGQSACTKCMSTNTPFDGGSGEILDRVFDRLGIKKKDIFITNVVHCHPPNNRPSSSREVSNCISFLLEEIRIVKPQLVIPLGRDARQVMEVELKPFLLKIKYIIKPIAHPAFLLYRRNPDMTEEYVKLLIRLMKNYV